MPLLVIERGYDKGLTVKVEPQKTYVVGRDNPQAAVRLTDPMASRAHFQILSSNGAWRLKDMKSRNGTLLNDEKLAPEKDADLKIGDKIQVGETIFSFLSDEKEETAGGLIGKVIGGYRLIERVGRGGMGTVYKAEQISLNRVVALKVLSSKLLTDPVFVQQFVAEAKAAGGLNHPNIVQVFDVGSDRGVYFFSMEYMDSGSAGDIVAKEGPIPWQRALEMMQDAARGLIFAEKKGIVHRDIKPDNLMLTSEGTVKIGDLGLARKADELTTEGGQIFGTPHFIAPEQAQGKAVDNRADIYALGATFYRVLSGKTPFTGENVKEILVKQVQEEPVPLKKLVADLPDEMAAVLAKMMKKRADDRYRSAQGLLDDLERIRVMYHIESHGQAASARRSKALAAVLALAVLGMAGIVYYYVNKPPPDPIEIIKRGPDQPVITGPGPSMTPEMLADNEMGPLSKEEGRLLAELKGGPGETWKGHEPKWLALAKKYEDLSKKYPETPAGREAARNARDIRKSIDDAKKAEQERQQKASSDLASLLRTVEGLVGQGRFAAAAKELSTKWESLRSESKGFLPEDAEKTVKATTESIATAAVERIEPALKEMEEAASHFPGGRYLDARRKVDALRPGLVTSADAKDAASERLRELLEQAKKSLRETRDAAYEAAAAALDQDRTAFFRASLAIRRWAAEGAPADAPESPFFAYRWDEALGRWEALLKDMKTRPFRDRVKGKIEQYRRCKRLFETIGARVRDKKIDNTEFPDTVEKGSQVILDSNRRADATADGVWTIRTSTRQKGFVEYREMTPRELYEKFLKKGEGIGFTPEDHLDLAVFLAEAACGEIAYVEFSNGTAPQDPSKLDPLRQWVMDESTASMEYYGQGGICAAFNMYADLRRQGTARPAELERQRANLELKIREFRNRETIYATDFFLLHHSQFGPDGEVPERVLPAKDMQEVLRTLGAEGGDLPPPDPPPPPPPGNGAPPGGGGTGGEKPADPPEEGKDGGADKTVKKDDGPEKPK